MYFRWLIKNKRLYFGLLILNFLYLMETIIYFFEIERVALNYSLANMTWLYEHPTMHMASSYRAVRAMPGAMILIDNWLIDFILPVLLAVICIGIDWIARKNN